MDGLSGGALASPKGQPAESPRGPFGTSFRLGGRRANSANSLAPDSYDEDYVSERRSPRPGGEDRSDVVPVSAFAVPTPPGSFGAAAPPFGVLHGSGSGAPPSSDGFGGLGGEEGVVEGEWSGEVSGLGDGERVEGGYSASSTPDSLVGGKMRVFPWKH